MYQPTTVRDYLGGPPKPAHHYEDGDHLGSFDDPLIVRISMSRMLMIGPSVCAFQPLFCNMTWKTHFQLPLYACSWAHRSITVRGM